MFDTKERAAMAANITGLLAAGKGWHTPSKDLVQIAEEILNEIELVYKPKAITGELKFFEEIRKMRSLNPSII